MYLVIDREIAKWRLRFDIALAKEIIKIDPADLWVECVHPVSALLRKEARVEIVIGQVAVVVHIHVQLVVDEPVPVGHLKLHGLTIDWVVGHWVAHQEPLQIGDVAWGLRVYVIIYLFS